MNWSILRTINMCIGIVLMSILLLLLFFHLHLGYGRAFLAAYSILGIPFLITMGILSLVKNRFFFITVFVEISYLIIYSMFTLKSAIVQLGRDNLPFDPDGAKFDVILFGLSTVPVLIELIYIIIILRTRRKSDIIR
jgi:hypothetical protein